MGVLLGWAQYVVCAVVLALLVRTRWNTRTIVASNGRALRKPPDTLPLVGNGIKFLQSRWKLFGWFDKCQRQFGYETVALTVPTLPPGVLIHDPRNLEFVFKHEGVFTKGNFVKGRSWDLFGNGIINADGELWKLQRKAGLAFLNTANLRVLTEVALPQYLFESVNEIKATIGEEVIDLQHVFHEITTKLMGRMAYNMEMHADDEFGTAFDYASGGTAERFQNPLWFITELFFGSKLRKSISIVKDFGGRIVAKAVHDRRGQKDEKSEVEQDDGERKLDQISGSLIQSLLDAIGDEQMVADAALTYLSAGRDTTGQALTWTFYLLMRHRDVADKVRQEVQRLFGERGVSPAQERFDSTLFTPVSMPYSMAVFYEALRLYPPIPFEIRQCMEDVTLPDGTCLPKHSVLVWCLWAMHRSKVTWGDDADEFRPERFLEHGKLVSKSSTEFPVFYGGARTCLGKKMAEAIAVQVIPTMAWLFNFTPVDQNERVSKTSLTMPMKDGLPVRVEVASRARGLSLETQ
ncbi:cytochrome P450 [Lasiosphaeria miniovina]|uniref:Cytochrome P450 n=1 Tax=Lasiosphaeria miniovina TaxID=1954250 RepID=A0AA40A5R5_9PEZI|nr:cytochrome P450 [Lasiosphaeria miniovina]KAK0709824.1 cytochrome P450 [Lasiosphaeria miniovina]